MIAASFLHGLIVIQSYDKAIIYEEEDRMLLYFLAQHLAGALDTIFDTQQRKESQLKIASSIVCLSRKIKI